NTYLTRIDFSSLLDASYASAEPLINKITDNKKGPALKTYVQKNQLISAIESKLGQYRTAVNASVSVSNGTLVVNPSKIGITLDFEQIAKQLEMSDMRAYLNLPVNLTTREPEILTEAAQQAKTQAETLIAPAYGISSGTDTKSAALAQKARWVVFTPNS